MNAQAPAVSRRHVRHNLPAEVSSFVGRRQQLADVKRLLSTTRLLTLAGPGVGKTAVVWCEGLLAPAWRWVMPPMGPRELLTARLDLAMSPTTNRSWYGRRGSYPHASPARGLTSCVCQFRHTEWQQRDLQPIYGRALREAGLG